VPKSNRLGKNPKRLKHPLLILLLRYVEADLIEEPGAPFCTSVIHLTKLPPRVVIVVPIELDIGLLSFEIGKSVPVLTSLPEPLISPQG